ncbi:LOW QUALITY PROTEIN: glutamine amidotransferase [Bacillus sp. JCM 19045]|nr:LOW QUALITY PROTEIN: glutamine amidotransferase [Bacillus sp. JCM 19045]
MVPAQANAEITPVTPNAQSMTKSLLNWIAEMPDRENERVLSGAFGGYAEREFSLHEANRLYQQTGKMPAIYGGDYAALNRFDWQNPLDAISTSINDELISYYDDGGLVQLSVHFPNPVYQNGNLNTPISNEQYRRILNDNTPEGGRFNRMLDKVADGLREFEDQEIPVLFRPLHEGNSYSFWWSMSGSVNEAERVTLYKQLYQKIFHHLTVNHDLTNLIWVYSPGEWKVTKRRCIQAIAMSILSDLMFIQMTDFSDVWGYQEMLDLGKPFAFAEIGPQTPNGQFNYQNVINSIRTHYPETTYFLAWNEMWSQLKIKGHGICLMIRGCETVTESGKVST